MDNAFEIRGKETIIFMKTTKGEIVEAKVSTMDLEKVRDFIGYWYPVWSNGTNSYYVLGYGGPATDEKKMYSLHRWIMDEPESFVIDHINHDTLDNTYSNLRIVSQSVNVLNRKNTGVTKYKDRWKAKFVFAGETYIVGYFDTEAEARAALEEQKNKMISNQQFWNEFENEQNYFVKQVQTGEGYN